MAPRPDEILARYRASDASYLHYHSDQFGNVKFLLDGSNVGKEKYSYDAYGAPTVTNWDGSNERTTSGFGNRFMFSGREYLSEANVYDYRARAYSAELGRFLQADPIGFAGDPANLYRYCANNPVNASDPNGLGNKLDGTSDGTGKYIPLGSHIPVPPGQSLGNAFYFPSGYASTNGWGSVSGNPTAGGSGSDIPVRRATDVNGYYADGTPSFGITPFGKFLGGIADLAGKIWTLPNTAIGLAIGIVSLPFGGDIDLRNNAIVIRSGLFADGALTLGNVILTGSTIGSLDNPIPTYYARETHSADQAIARYGFAETGYGMHEQGHTYQNQLFGPFFLPAYLLNHPFSAASPFENAADRYGANQGSWVPGP